MKDKQQKQAVPRKEEQPKNTGKPVTQQEEMQRRQSAPQPTAQDAAARIYATEAANAKVSAASKMADNAMNGFHALTQVIGREQIQEARHIMMEYKQGKSNLEQKVIENEQWYKLRNWECMRKGKGKTDQVEPVSGWLFNSIANKHADAMDNFPSPNILPREESDKGEAEILTSIVPVILEQNNFEETYDLVVDDKLKGGTGVYGIFWDSSKLNGLGDISIEQQDILSLFWQPGITDIQKSLHFFHVKLVENEILEAEFPQLQGKLSSSAVDVSKYIYDDTVETTTKSAVIDWYYKKRNGKRTILHYCKFCNDEVLFATENEPGKYPNGWYDHGQYPFVFDPLFRMKGTPCGFGYIDVAKSAQEYIDRGNQAILQNMLANAKPRHFIRADGSVNEAEYADMTKDFVHVDGNLGQDSILPIQGKPLNTVYVNVIKDKVDELKETTGNRDVSTGGTTSGATAASAIAAMQEAGSKLSRDNNKSSYRSYRKLVLMTVELIRQFYDLPRCFRIMGENGAARYVQYSNAGIQPQKMGVEYGIDLGFRVPLFDIEITAQKQSPYSKMSQNEMALQFYTAGFFNPQMADQALACLEMMDFDRKQFIMQKVSQNGTMFQQMMMMQQQMLMLAQMVDQDRGTNLAEQIAAVITGGAPVTPTEGEKPEKVANNTSLGGEGKKAESGVTKNARKRVAESTSPT